MENQEVFNIDATTREVVIVHKNGLDDLEPASISINGTIESAGNYLEKVIPAMIKDSPVLVQRDSVIIINREELKIKFEGNLSDPQRTIRVSGKLIKHPDFEKWGINAGTEWGNEKLGEFIKMNRSNFDSKEVAMKLSDSLKNFRMKVDKELEAMNDNRGNVRALAVQKVKESSIPESFKLFVPVFKGQPKQEFTVEIYINASTFGITLVSPDANDIIAEVRDEIIDNEIDRIEELAPNIPIIEE